MKHIYRKLMDQFNEMQMETYFSFVSRALAPEVPCEEGEFYRRHRKTIREIAAVLREEFGAPLHDSYAVEVISETTQIRGGKLVQQNPHPVLKLTEKKNEALKLIGICVDMVSRERKNTIPRQPRIVVKVMPHYENVLFHWKWVKPLGLEAGQYLYIDPHEVISKQELLVSHLGHTLRLLD